MRTDTDGERPSMRAHFSDPEAVARYAEGPPRYVPGFAGLHRMTAVLLAERTPERGRVLVLGAGGGLELEALAETQPGWSFVGVDPSVEMLRLAQHRLGPRMERVELVRGYVEDAPNGPFDAATCLLTLHFLDAEERLRTLRELHRRLRPGVPLVTAHLSFPQRSAERPRWLSRYAAFARASGAQPDQAENARATIEERLHLFEPAQDEAILREAGFAEAELFFAAFTWRGWVAQA